MLRPVGSLFDIPHGSPGTRREDAPLEILGVERDGDGILVRGRNLGNCGLPELELGDLGPLVVESAEETLIVAELPGGILPAD